MIYFYQENKSGGVALQALILSPRADDEQLPLIVHLNLVQQFFKGITVRDFLP
jgi:hypothetical protein